MPRRAGAALLVALIGIGIVGATSAVGAATKPKPLVTLRIATSSYTAPFAPLYVGVARGFFAQVGINLVIDNVAGGNVAAIVSGRDQFAEAGATVPFTSTAAGAPVQFIAAAYGGGVTGFVAGLNSVASIKDCTTMATFTKGAATYAWSTALLKAAGNTTATLVSESAFGNIGTSLASGAVDCATGTYDILSAVVAAGKAHLLVDTRQKSSLPAYLRTMPEAGIVALSSWLKSHSSLATKFLEAFNQSVAYAKATPPLALSKQVDSTAGGGSGFLAIPTSALAAALQVQISFYAPNHGLLTAAGFKNLTQFVNGAGIVYTGPQYSYSSLVNMSYLQAAIKHG